MASLNTDIRYIKGVGETRAKAMERLGIFTLRDLISHFPRAYEDRTAFKEIKELTPGENVCVRAMAVSSPRISHIRKGLDILKLRVVDGAGAMEITYFNQSYLRTVIKPGESYVFYGCVGGSPGRPEMINPIVEAENIAGKTTGRIMPLYALTAGITQGTAANAVSQGLAVCADELPDILPEPVRSKFKLCSVRYAYENIHFPKDFAALEIARRRLVFEELFVLSAAMRLMRGKRTGMNGRALTIPSMDEFYAALPFELTGAQKRAVDDALSDMRSGRAPMSRLVQGDVGSGKTIAAAACCFAVWRAGCQCAFMVPTEILAKQHYNSLSQLLGKLGMNTDLLIGSMTAKKKREVHARLASGETDLVIGTHAIISENVSFKDLALVITDEQHRFGVQQRSALTAKGTYPHVLVMSATPIPRTLALMIYGDLDVSVIDELPPGRQKVDTFAVGEDMRDRINRFIRRLVSEGRQVYIVCPTVGDPEIDQHPDETMKAAEKYAAELKNNVFPDLSVGIVHGRMKAADKEKVMSSFSAGETSILVATTVIEVGVDVPNAALMVVENADRFGLSQLHQLRGRVGRGKHKSYCVLFEGSGSETSRERLKAMCATNDGFRIAEEDLKLRGPGDFFGSRQHGLPELHIADIAADMDILTQAQTAAGELIADDPQLAKPGNRKIRAHIERMFEHVGTALN